MLGEKRRDIFVSLTRKHFLFLFSLKGINHHGPHHWASEERSANFHLHLRFLFLNLFLNLSRSFDHTHPFQTHSRTHVRTHAHTHTHTHTTYIGFKLSAALPASDAVLEIAKKFKIPEPQYFGIFCPDLELFLPGGWWVRLTLIWLIWNSIYFSN